MFKIGIAFGFVGGAGLFIYLLLFAGLVELGGLRPTISGAVAFIPVLMVSYYLNRRFVFRSRRSHREAIPRYLALTGVGFLINASVLYFGTEVLDWWYGHAQFLSFLLVPVGNFLLSRVWVFRDCRIT